MNYPIHFYFISLYFWKYDFHLDCSLTILLTNSTHTHTPHTQKHTLPMLCSYLEYTLHLAKPYQLFKAQHLTYLPWLLQIPLESTLTPLPLCYPDTCPITLSITLTTQPWLMQLFYTWASCPNVLVPLQCIASILATLSSLSNLTITLAQHLSNSSQWTIYGLNC